MTDQNEAMPQAYSKSNVMSSTYPGEPDAIRLFLWTFIQMNKCIATKQPEGPNMQINKIIWPSRGADNEI
jgi:hypothetical protein